jgi:hypothetical protein
MLCCVMLFNRMSGSLGILYFHGGIIINNNNGITYYGESHEFLAATLDMSHNRLSRRLYDQLG